MTADQAGSEARSRQARPWRDVDDQVHVTDMPVERFDALLPALATADPAPGLTSLANRDRRYARR